MVNIEIVQQPVSLEISDVGLQGATGPTGPAGAASTVPGPAGNPTAFELRGTGFPEGVVTANPGTYYTDSSVTNGAIRWVKKSGTGNTGWIVVIGDTGWRRLAKTAALTNGNLDVKRVDSRVIYMLSAGAIASTNTICDPATAGINHNRWYPPAAGGGFAYRRAQALYYRDTYSPGFFGFGLNDTSFGITMTGSVGGEGYGLLEFEPHDLSWPSVLPGTAV